MWRWGESLRSITHAIMGLTHGHRSPDTSPSGPRARQNSPSTSRAGPLPVQNSPRHPSSPHVRYKTLPAHPKWLDLAHFLHAGRVLYRSHHQEAKQGEFCTECEAESGLAMTAHHAHERGGHRRARRAPVGLAAAPVGGGKAWPGFETTRRATHQQPSHWCGGRRRDRRARAGFEARRRTK